MKRLLLHILLACSCVASSNDTFANAVFPKAYAVTESGETVILEDNDGVYVGVIASNIRPVSVYDADALAYISAVTATGATLTTTEKNAVNQLVLDFKAASIWNKYVAIYPCLGGTANAHAINLKNPSIFTLTWVGSITHSSNGVAWNSSYARTGVIPSLHLSQNGAGISYYSRTVSVATTAGNAMMGSSSSGLNDGLYILPYYWDGSSYLGVEFSRGNSNSTTLGTYWTNSANFFQISRVGSTGFTSSRAASQNTNSIGSSGVSGSEIYLGAINTAGAPNSFSVYEMAYADINTGLTTSEMTAAYNAVQAFETTVGRQVP